jgi:phosphatidylglycerol:prolipoprotein diacylglycerol transferase
MGAYITFPEWLKPEIIPGLSFRWYSLLYLIALHSAFLFFILLALKRRYPLRIGVLIGAFFLGFLGGLIGAHAFYLFFFDRSGLVFKAPWALILPFDAQFRFTGYQGMNWFGGVFTAAAVIVLFLKLKKADILESADALIVCVPLAQAFGRIGNFTNGELYGRLTAAPWGMIFREQESYEGVHGPVGLPAADPRVVDYAGQAGISANAPYLALPRHPTQIYELIFECLLIWIVLWIVYRRYKPFKGFALGLYCALYGATSFVIGYFREPLRLDFFLKLGPQDNPPYLLLTPFNISLEQLFSIVMLAGGIVMLFLFAARAKRRATVSPAIGGADAG